MKKDKDLKRACELLQSQAYKLAIEFNTQVFHLTKPYILKVTISKRFTLGQWAEWSGWINDDGELDYHLVKLSYDRLQSNAQELRNTIFHELAHAKIHELGGEPAHDAQFWQYEKIAKKFNCTIRFEDDNYDEYV